MAATISVQDYERAERELKREEARRGFRLHSTVYVAINLMLIAINLLVIAATSATMIWFVYPLVGWGIGLTMHYIFGVRLIDAEITERQERVERRAATG